MKDLSCLSKALTSTQCVCMAIKSASFNNSDHTFYKKRVLRSYERHVNSLLFSFIFDSYVFPSFLGF